MSEDQAWKRSQAVDTISDFPWTFELLKEGKTKLSQLAMLKTKLTKNNEAVIKDEVSGKSRAELKDFLETVDKDGERIEPVSTVELKLRLKKDVLAKLQRIRSLKTKTKFAPSMEEVIEAMADLWLAKNDPLEKAKRHAEKKPNCPGAGADERKPEPEKEETAEKKMRYIKAEVRHQLFKAADKGCDFIGTNGKRCGSMHQLQIEHQIPFAMGGDNSINNKKIYCLAHNQYAADLMFGRRFMDEKRGL